jgi:hypothetical protein
MSKNMAKYQLIETREEECKKALFEGATDNDEYFPNYKNTPVIEEPYEIPGWIQNRRMLPLWGRAVASPDIMRSNIGTIMTVGKVFEAPSIVPRSSKEFKYLSAKDIVEKLSEFEFNLLSKKWKEECIQISFLEEMLELDSYQEILKMRERAIPFLLKDLQKTKDYWFQALKSITGEDVVKQEHYNDFDKMTEDWIKWGVKKSYI